jgi:hypothetical protein
MGRSSEVAPRSRRSEPKRTSVGAATSATIKHTVETPPEVDCVTMGHFPESHMSCAPRYGYNATKAVTRIASANRYVRLMLKFLAV